MINITQNRLFNNLTLYQNLRKLHETQQECVLTQQILQRYDVGIYLITELDDVTDSSVEIQREQEGFLDVFDI